MPENMTSSGTQCPECQSNDLMHVDPPGVAFTKDYRCNACGCQWQPGVPIWGVVLLVAVGVAILIFCAWGYLEASHSVPSQEYWDPRSQGGAEARSYGTILMLSIPGLLFLVYGIKEIVRPSGVKVRKGK